MIIGANLNPNYTIYKNKKNVNVKEQTPQIQKQSQTAPAFTSNLFSDIKNSASIYLNLAKKRVSIGESTKYIKEEMDKGKSLKNINENLKFSQRIIKETFNARRKKK